MFITRAKRDHTRMPWQWATQHHDHQEEAFCGLKLQRPIGQSSFGQTSLSDWKLPGLFVMAKTG
jgi:hypothetical protein